LNEEEPFLGRSFERRADPAWRVRTPDPDPVRQRTPVDLGGHGKK